jgi:hypothetical protein
MVLLAIEAPPKMKRKCQEMERATAGLLIKSKMVVILPRLETPSSSPHFSGKKELGIRYLSFLGAHEGQFDLEVIFPPILEMFS